MAPGTNWETKQWRSAAFAEVARDFLQKGCAVTLIGSDRERAVCEKVAELAPGTVNLAGETTLGELAALIRRATVCVTNDSGPMHLAVALDRPVVSIFGPTDPVWAGPYRRDGAVLRADLPCSPCYLRQLSRCTQDMRACRGYRRRRDRAHRWRSRQTNDAPQDPRAASKATLRPTMRSPSVKAARSDF